MAKRSYTRRDIDEGLALWEETKGDKPGQEKQRRFFNPQYNVAPMATKLGDIFPQLGGISTG